MNQKKCQQMFVRLAADNPSPAIELIYETPFQLLIAAVFSAQSTDVGVNRVTKSLFLEAPTPQAMLDLGYEKLVLAIRHLGLYRNKAKHAIGICEALVDKYQGVVPSTKEALESLPGVGRKTANIILNTVFAEPVIAVDTHVFRVANRTRIACGKTVRAVEEGLMQIVPSEFRQQAHHWLVLLGRYVCKARKPHCAECVVIDYCEFPEKNLQKILS